MTLPTCEATWPSELVAADDPDFEVATACSEPASARALIGAVPTWVCEYHESDGDLPVRHVAHLLDD